MDIVIISQILSFVALILIMPSVFIMLISPRTFWIIFADIEDSNNLTYKLLLNTQLCGSVIISLLLQWIAYYQISYYNKFILFSISIIYGHYVSYIYYFEVLRVTNSHINNVIFNILFCSSLILINFGFNVAFF